MRVMPIDDFLELTEGSGSDTRAYDWARLVKEGQAAWRNVAQDRGGLGHLNHEGAPPPADIIAGAGAQEDTVRQANTASRPTLTNSLIHLIELRFLPQIC